MHISKYIRIIFVVLALSVFFIGCKETEKSKKSAKSTKLIQSTPAGAAILFNGSEIGKTPYTVTAKPNFYVIKLAKHGYRTRYVSFNLKAGSNPAGKYTLEPASASVLVDSSPKGAYVTFNNKRVGETPCVLPDLPFGNHSVRLTKSGCAPKDLTFSVNSERPIKVSSTLESNIGNIHITSNPSEARVLMNGKPVGITPLRGEYPDGEYKIKLQRSNYLDHTATLIVRKGANIRKHYKLHLRPGTFRIVTNPAGAKVYFGGKFVGNSPVTIKDQVANTDHHLIITHSGYATLRNKIRTTPGREEVFTYNLKRNRGDLEFVINPPGVTVFIDGKKYCVTQKSDTDKTSKVITVKNLTPGNHVIRYTHRRAVPASNTIRVKISAGEITRLDPISLWVPNAEIIYNDDSKENVIILSEDGKGVYVAPLNGIRYTVLRSKIKKINYFKDNE